MTKYEAYDLAVKALNAVNSEKILTADNEYCAAKLKELIDKYTEIYNVLSE